MKKEVIWKLPTDLLATSLRVMKPHGAIGNEGIAFWYGRRIDHEVEVTHIVEVHGYGIQHSPLQLRVSLRAMEALTDLVDRIDSHLVGQIHSHPSTMLGLSDVDKSNGIRIQDYLSLVSPYYAQIDVLSVEDCGVHVFDDGRYRRFQIEEIRRRIRISPSKVIPIALEVHV
jgi:proteasome lid subunit RPN8/RPN11